MASNKALEISKSATDNPDVLLQGCRVCLAQCDELLQLISATDYCQKSDGAASVGAHMRHILDRFLCFYSGLQSGSIDYDARKRDPLLESSHESARFALQSVVRRCEEPMAMGFRDRSIVVREAVHQHQSAIAVGSTVEREMMALVTHSIHHLAIIAILMGAQGYRFSPEIGKAPSTLQYELS